MSRGQRQETLKFWDDFYAAKQNAPQEWILQPNQALFDRLLDAAGMSDNRAFDEEKGGAAASLSSPRRAVCRILEIGCGTSTLSRDLFLYWQQISRSASKNKNDATTALQVVATDVSEVCIQQLLKRDAKTLHRQQQRTKDAEACSFLEYKVWNLTLAPPESFLESFDLILDKGCLDTFLFRSRQRGPPQQDEQYVNGKEARLTTTVLNHIHMCLVSCDGNEYHHRRGQYLLLSPRCKIKVVRDYPGFLFVAKHLLDDDQLFKRGELDGQSSLHTSSTLSSSSSKKQLSTFLHVCQKNDTYCPGRSNMPVTGKPCHPTETSTCSTCGMTFYDFRKGERMDGGRGRAFWYRRWAGHCTHCRCQGNLESQDDQ